MTDSEKKNDLKIWTKLTRKRKKSCGLHYTGTFKKTLRKKKLKHLKCMLYRLILLLKVMSEFFRRK